ncbi:MAG: histidine kinase N-terminal 7TM domain-containing protein [Caldilineaceae bacterium]
MNWQFAIVVVALLGGIVLDGAFWVMVWQRRQQRGAYAFMALMIGLTLWSASYCIELLNTSLAAKFFWHRAAYLGITTVPATWFYFNLRLTFPYSRWLPRLMPLLLIEPIIVIVLSWHSEWYALLWDNFRLQPFGGQMVLAFDRHAGFVYHSLYSYILLTIGSILYGSRVFRVPSIRLSQMVLLVLGIVAPFFINVIYVFDLSPIPLLDLTPLALTTTGATAGWFIFYFELRDVLPILHRALFESMNDGVIMLDFNLRIANLNPTAARWLNTREAAALDQPIEDLLPGSQEIIQGYLSSQPGISPKNTVLMLSRSTSGYRYVDLSVSSLHDRRDRHIGQLLVMRNVSRLKRTEQALRESESRYRNLIELSPDAIVVTGMDTVITVCNQSAVELYGVTSHDELVGRRGIDMIKAEHRSRMLESMRHILQTLTSGEATYTLIRHDGSAVEVEINSSLLYDNNTPTGFLSIVRDISERLRAEETIRQAQRMEGIGVLAGGVAHDFNNLLTSILAQNSLALAHLEQNERATQHILKSVKSAERAADLTRQLLAYAGKGQFQIQELDVNELIRENDALIETAVSKSINLILTLDEYLPLIKADRGQLQQVIMNLVINAAEAIESGIGEIEIQTGVCLLSAADLLSYVGHETLKPGPFVFVMVRDSGVGISAATMARIFDPFFTTKTDGRGLGLSALLGVIRSHGGGLHVKTAPGQGSTFTVVFPPLDEPLGEQNSPVASNQQTLLQNLTGTVLIVEDEEPVRVVLQELLELSGLRVLTAENGREGLSAFAKHITEIDMVLLDLQMPIMGGREALTEMRKIRPDISVIVFSGYSESQFSQSPEDAAATLFIQKPFHPPSLVETVAAVLNGKIMQPAV